jgi:hypothetical protein
MNKKWSLLWQFVFLSFFDALAADRDIFLSSAQKLLGHLNKVYQQAIFHTPSLSF